MESGQLKYHTPNETMVFSADWVGMVNSNVLHMTEIQTHKEKAIRDYLIQHLDEKISLEHLAKEAHLSLTVFHKVFSHIYGDTPYAYLKKYKMNLAADILLNENKKIGDIALELGYSNASKFAKAFQSVYGVLPKDYRKKKWKKWAIFSL